MCSATCDHAGAVDVDADVAPEELVRARVRGARERERRDQAGYDRRKPPHHAASAGGRAGREADLRRLALRVVLDVEELALGEAERPRDEDAGHRLDRVVAGSAPCRCRSAARPRCGSPSRRARSGAAGSSRRPGAPGTPRRRRTAVRAPGRGGLRPGPTRPGVCACCAAARASVTFWKVSRSCAA